MGKAIKPYRMLVGKPEGRKETTKCRCDDNIKRDLKETDVLRGFDLRGTGQGQSSVLFHCDKLSCSTRCGVFLTRVQILSFHQEALCSVGLEKYCRLVV